MSCRSNASLESVIVLIANIASFSRKIAIISAVPVTPLRGIKEKPAGKSGVLYAKGSELVNVLILCFMLQAIIPEELFR